MKKLSAFVLVLLSGCGTRANLETEEGSRSRGIRFGNPTNRYPSVVALVSQSGNTKKVFCTATAIDTRVVLTAGHCAEVLRQQPSSRFLVRTTSRELAIDAGIFHSEYSPVNTVGSVDLALLRVIGTLTDFSPIITQEVDLGERLTAVGFGQNGEGADGNGTVGVKRVGELILTEKRTAIGRTGASIPNALLFFDHSDLQVDQAACPGDSGGPVLMNGAIAGVVSGGQMFLGIRRCIYSLNSIYTSAFAFRSWIKAGVARLVVQ